MKGLPVNSSRVLSAVVLLAVSGCQCKSNSLVSADAELVIVWDDEHGLKVENRDAFYDFGEAFVGERRELTMFVKNAGSRTLSLAELVHVSGDAVDVPSLADQNPASFSVGFYAREVDPGATLGFVMEFSPKQLKPDFRATLRLVAHNAAEGKGEASVTLMGNGQAGECKIPDVIDFGTTPLGATVTHTIELKNTASVAGTATVGAIAGVDAAAFAFTADSARGDVEVGPTSSKLVKITFRPTELRSYSAQLDVQGVGGCPTKTVLIKGLGSNVTLSWRPIDTLDFGFVNLGDEGYRELTFINPSGGQISLTGVTTTDPAHFYQAVNAGSDPSRFTVAGGGESKMTMVCKPSALGPLTATLTFQTGLSSPSEGSLRLTCVGGGPRIRVTPRPTVQFGRVGYFPGSSAYSVSRTVLISNIGSRPPMPTAASNLHLGSVLPDGTPGQMPYIELRPGSGLMANELQASLGAYNPATGLEATAGQTLQLTLTLRPQSIGNKEAELVIHSNDASEPVVRLKVTAQAQTLTPCRSSISPMELNFGSVSPGAPKDQSVTITNLGTGANDTCYFTGIELQSGSNPAFSIVGGPIVEKEVLPGQSFNVTVRVDPQGSASSSLSTLTGALRFDISNPMQSQATVLLKAVMGPTCLAVAPDPLDFGLVKVGCRSASKTLTLYNTCARDVYLKAVALPAGQSEFAITQLPTIPPAGLLVSPTAAPVTVQARYAPINVGADTGVLSIDVLQDGQPMGYLVSLTGRADATGIQTERFTQDAQSKADVLMVIDDSCSMDDKQMLLASNFNSFIQFAVSANVDYHMAVTTTTVALSEQFCLPPFGCGSNVNQSVAPGGAFHAIAAIGTSPAVGPILKPSTSNVADAFRSLVRVGTNGSGTEQGLETAVLALTPPLSTAANAGFLRADANLAVVVVTDADDQSPQPVAYYQSRLLNIKGANRSSMFTFSNIGPYLSPAPTGACTYDGSGVANRYRSVVMGTGGVRAEICNTNWGATLQQLGQTAFGARTQFFLTNQPAAGQPLDVKINGMSLPAGAWSYDSASNSINFTATSRPQAGQTLTITYPVTCL